MTIRTPFDAVIEAAGSQSALARELGVSRQLVNYWKRHGVPAKRMLELAKQYPSVRWPELAGLGDSA